MSYLNTSVLATTSSLFEDQLNNSSNSTQTDVASSLQMTRFIVQSVLTPLVVVIGLLGNMLNIMVLLQPSMRTSTNIYILVLSLADSVFLVFNIVLSLVDCRKRGLSYAAYHFNPYGRFVSNFSGNVAVLVTVSFTVERYIAVCHPMRGKVWCTVYRAKMASLAVTLLALINTIPTIFERRVVETKSGLRCVPTELADSMFYSWWYVTLFTFIPLVCLALFNIVLIKVLFVASKNRQKLVMTQPGTSSSPTSGRNTKNHVIYKQTVCVNQNGNGNNSNSNSNNIDASAQNNGPRGANSQLSSNDVTVRHNTGDSQYSLSRDINNHTSYNDHKQNYSSEVSPSLQQKPYYAKTALLTGRKSNALSSKSSKTGDHSNSKNIAKRQSKRMSREQHKVTLLLVTIVMIFLLTQLPWTALFLYITYLDNNSLTGNATHLKIAGNICNLLVLINASVNFYLYSCFSKKFRQILKDLVLFWRRKSNPTTITF